jgi:hypothetical protein
MMTCHMHVCRAAAAFKSRLHLDHYNRSAVAESEARERELGRLGKRPVLGGKPGGAQHFMDVMQHTCATRPEVTAGDAW